MTDKTVIIWWNSLCLIACLNITLLFISYRLYKKNQKSNSSESNKIRWKQFLLAGLYAIGCSFRAILPRGDLRRIVMVDSWISSVVIGRTVATIAELSFVAQWSFLLYEAGKNTGNKRILMLSKIPFPLIVIAEIFSWYACTTSNYIGTVVEESLWAVAAFITVYGLFLARPYYMKEQLKFLNRGIVAGILYVIYMLCVDIPAYVSNWMAAEKIGKIYKSVGDGFKEVCTEWSMTRAYADWQYEMIWMSLYFSVAVWMSIYLINAPRLDKNIK